MNLEKEHKTGIFCGLISTFIFIYFLQPILDWVSIAVVKVLTITSSAFLDRIYAQAAHLQTQDFSFLWLLFLSSIFAVCIFFIGVIRVSGISILERIRIAMANVSNFPRNPASSYSSKKGSKWYRILSGLLLIIFSLSIVVVFSANYIQLKTISSFQQHMRIIAPYVDDSEMKTIYSRWSLMKTYSDYEAIYTEIQSHAKQHNIELPENKIYSPTTL